jgi:hypothetical protein
MKKIFYVFILFSFSRQSLGQTNLVPNPSFEDTIKCPVSVNQTITTTYWSSVGGTSDYYNSCRNASMCGVSVPSNMGGYQMAATGNAYCGLITYVDSTLVGGSNGREYIGTQLISPLVIGTKYYVSFKVCLAEGNCDGPTNTAWDFYIATNKIGVKFMTNPFSPFLSAPPVFNSAHVFSNAIITDSINWTTIKGSIVADSNYKYIVCGNFFSDINTSTLSVGPTNHIAYYFIDDVCVSTDSTTQVIGINEHSVKENSFVYPNPTSGHLYFKIPVPKTGTTFKVTDKYGQIILIKNDFKENEIDVSAFQDGLYFIEIVSGNKKYYTKLIVQH